MYGTMASWFIGAGAKDADPDAVRLRDRAIAIDEATPPDTDGTTLTERYRRIEKQVLAEERKRVEKAASAAPAPVRPAAERSLTQAAGSASAASTGTEAERLAAMPMDAVLTEMERLEKTNPSEYQRLERVMFEANL